MPVPVFIDVVARLVPPEVLEDFDRSLEVAGGLLLVD